MGKIIRIDSKGEHVTSIFGVDKIFSNEEKDFITESGKMDFSTGLWAKTKGYMLDNPAALQFVINKTINVNFENESNSSVIKAMMDDLTNQLKYKKYKDYSPWLCMLQEFWLDTDWEKKRKEQLALSKKSLVSLGQSRATKRAPLPSRNYELPAYAVPSPRLEVGTPEPNQVPTNDIAGTSIVDELRPGFFTTAYSQAITADNLRRLDETLRSFRSRASRRNDVTRSMSDWFSDPNDQNNNPQF